MTTTARDFVSLARALAREPGKPATAGPEFEALYERLAPESQIGRAPWLQQRDYRLSKLKRRRSQ